MGFTYPTQCDTSHLSTCLDLVVSSCNIPTIPLAVAQAMNPAPRPPSPGARAATQKAMRPENPNQLTQRDAQVLLMGVAAKEKGGTDRARLDSFFTTSTSDTRSTTSAEPSTPRAASASKVPPRPSREMRRLNSLTESTVRTCSISVPGGSLADTHLLTDVLRRRGPHRLGERTSAEEPPGVRSGGAALWWPRFAPARRGHQGQAGEPARARFCVPLRTG